MMRHGWLSISAAAFALACHHPASGGTTSNISGAVWEQPCAGVSGAQVIVYGGSASAATDATGRFALNQIPSDSALELHADGHVPTLTTRHAFKPDEADLLFALVPNQTLDTAYLLAGETQQASAGTVAIGVAGSERLPVAGATVTLKSSSGATLQPRYLDVTHNLPTFGATSTAAGVGIAVFLNVSEGEYQLSIQTRAFPLADISVPVRAGYLTADIVTGPTPTGEGPIVLKGDVRGTPLDPAPGVVVPTPLQGAAVTLTTEPDGQTWVATTDSSGLWEIDVPFGYRQFDFTVSASGYATWRGELGCLTTHTDYTLGFRLLDPVIAHNWFALSRHGRPVDPTAGQLSTYIAVDQMLGLPPNVTVTMTPAAVAADYGSGGAGWPSTCLVASACGPSVPCPSGSRCEGGECVQGDAPFCSRCGTNYACPTGYLEHFEGASATDCFCVSEVDDCRTATCPTQTMCDIRRPYTNETGTYFQDCVPWRESPTVAAGGIAYFPNVPPGNYTLRAQAPGFNFFPMSVRVDANVFSEGVFVWNVAP